MTHCPSRDAVLAHFLDNDGVCAPAGDPAQLTSHVAECDQCRQALALTRRLDALIAATAGADVDASAAQRVWIGTTQALREPKPRMRSRARRVVLAAALMAAGFAFALLVERDDRRQQPAAASPEIASAPPPPVVVDVDAQNADPRETRILIPMLREAIPVRRSARDLRASAPSAQELVSLAERGDLAGALRGMVIVRAAGMGMPLPGGATAVSSGCATSVRTAALRELASRADRYGTAAIARVLAAEPAGPDLESMVAAARAVPVLADGFSHRAAGARACERAILEAGALIGGARLDASLRDVVRGNLEATDIVATAAGRVTERPGRIALLLALWSDLQARGLEARSGAEPADHAVSESPTEARARRWFAFLPRAATAELIEEARRTRSAEQRRRCLLALAARGDDAAISYLLELVEGHRRDESELAAHALGRCGAAAVTARAVPRIETSRRPELLWAALASSGAAMSDTALQRLELSDEERSFLRAGAFSLQQFGIAAALFRNRHGPPSF